MRFRLAPLLAVLVVFFGFNSVLAQSVIRTDLTIQQKEAFYRAQGIVFYDTAGQGGCSIAPTIAAESNATATGENNIEAAMSFFKQKGLSAEQSVGIVVNLIAESGLDPHLKENQNGSAYLTISSVDEITAGTGYGIAQWTPAGRQNNWKNFATSKGADALSLQLQLDFLWEEMTVTSAEASGYPHLVEAKNDAKQATWIFLSFFERPGAVIRAGKHADPIQPTSGDALAVLDARFSIAADILTEYGDVSGNIIPNGSPCSGSSADTNLISEPSFGSLAVTVDEGPPGEHKEENCTGDFTIGAAALKDYVNERWAPEVYDVSGYSCRDQDSPGSPTSIHGIGRAIDIMIDGTNPEHKIIGDQIRNFLINNAEELGIQRVIWTEHVWSANREGWRDYTGPHPHNDHLHVEINVEASNKGDLI